MKKQIFLLGAAAALFTLGSCSSSDDGPKSPADGNGEGVQSYISVNIFNSDGNGTRAGEMDGEPSSESAKYEDGTGNENKISSVRFFFFNNAGSPVDVKYVEGSNTLINYYDVNASENGDLGTADAEIVNVEKLVAAQIVLTTENKDNVKLPTKMVAVINPSQAFKDETNSTSYTLDNLKKVAKDYASLTDEAFPMVNSVYADNEKGILFENDIQGHVKETSDDAKDEPVDIYVERTVAKVSVSLGFKNKLHDLDVKTNNNITYVPLTTVNENSYTAVKDANDKQVYIKITGWNVASYVDKSLLVKDLTGVTSESVSGFTLSWPAYHRSYWANTTNNNVLNPANVHQWTKGWKDLTIGFNESDKVYVNENTDETSFEQYTKVVLGAQLVTIDESFNETPYTYIKWGGANYGKSEFEELLLSWIEDQLGSKIYVKGEEEGLATYKTLSMSDLDIKTAAEVSGSPLDKEHGDNGVRYKVTVTLKDGEYYKDNKGETKIDNSDISGILTRFGSITYYNSGMCYYYFPIKHLGNTVGKGLYGVVRNHVYKCNIDDITGFGTAVYDEDEAIYPEHPKDDNFYVAAKINVLSWRIVKNNYQLNW